MGKKSKTAKQQAYMRKTYVRFPLDLRPDVLAAYKAACARNNTTPTAEIKKFIAEYVEKAGGHPRQLFMVPIYHFFY